MTEKRFININGQEIKVLIDKKNKTAKIGDLEFNQLTDLIYFVNKITDIAEELNEEEYNDKNV